MKIKIKIIVFILSLMFVNPSCQKDIDTITVEGFVRDEASSKLLDGIKIFVDAIEPSSGMGIIGGRRESVGQGTTDSRGYFKIKLKVFENAQRLDFHINADHLKEGYTYSQEAVYLTTLNKQGNNSLTFKLSPTAQLKIKFKNATPTSNSDLFNFSYTSYGNGWYKGILKKESCGTVEINEAANWIGKDVCGDYIVETIAEKMTRVYWNVLKNNVNRVYVDSVFIRRGIMNEFSINY